MAIGTTAILTFRIDPGLKEALRAVAQREHRSFAHMVEVLIRDYCGRHRIDIAHGKADGNKKTSKRIVI